MIPKIIHYCWFGHGPLPKSARKCIASWKRFFPDYIIKEWNEENFDVNIIPYTSEAYQKGKYAFVSDYARFYILYMYGGIYFDTDVEVIRPMNDIVNRGAFMGMENIWGINSGLGIGATDRMEIYKEILDFYSNIHFFDDEGNQIEGSVVTHVTNIFLKKGFILEDKLQYISDIWIYPNDYFNPLNDATGQLFVTDNTRSIHWYSKSWIENYGPLRIWTTRFIHRYLGLNSISWIKKYIHI